MATAQSANDLNRIIMPTEEYHTIHEIWRDYR